MHDMLVPAKSESDKTYIVLKHYLPHLIKERKIRRFRRWNEWLDIDADERKKDPDERKKDSDGYQGRERRLSNRVDWSLLPLSIEEQLRRGHSVEAVLGYGERAREIALKLKNVAKTNLSVLIQGKTGTGKGVAALILHELSKRKDKPFIRVDCGAIPPTLIESELFGYEKGSFTGALRSKPGRFQRANGGTIFLDEIANLNMDMQTRLLGFLEERVVNSIGGIGSVRLDVRILSASNADLLNRVRALQFREDLYYRLNEFEVYMPLLKERADDLFYLATKFLAMANVELQKDIFGFSEGVIDLFSGYEWKGNIRELKNVIKRAALFADEMIEVDQVLNHVSDGETTESLDGCLENGFIKSRPLHEINDMIRRVAEKRVIRRVYDQSLGNKKKTCEALGIDYSTLFRKMKRYTIQ